MRVRTHQARFNSGAGVAALAPSTDTQIKDGQQVAPGNVQAGGLIFSKYSWDSRGPGHVQLAISPTEVVRRRPLRQPSWQARHLASSGLHQGVVLRVTVCL